MDEAKSNQSNSTKVVMVRVCSEKNQGKSIHLLFSTNQVEEVLQDIDKRPVPFGPDYLLGLCLWRWQILPVIDIEKQFGLHSDSTDNNDRYVVVRAAVPDSLGKIIMRCALKVSDQITTAETPESCTPVTADPIRVEPSFIKGIFECEDDILIVPDLISIFRSG